MSILTGEINTVNQRWVETNARGCPGTLANDDPDGQHGAAAQEEPTQLFFQHSHASSNLPAGKER